MWNLYRIAFFTVFAVSLVLPGASRAAPGFAQIQSVVGQVVQPMMKANGIPGMAVGILIDGRPYVFNYGTNSISPDQPVTDDTLFEIGSISKAFAATLAAYADQRGKLSLAGMASTYLPDLRGSAFDHVSLIDLGTHTAGGLPLQVPDGIDNNSQLMAYYKAWKPNFAPGTMRVYANTGIGLLGIVTAHSMHQDYATLVQENLFPAFGMHHSFIRIPPSELKNYAQGHTDDGSPIRLQMGPAGPETYGVRTTATDLLRFLAINMGLIGVDPVWQAAVNATHTGYDRLAPGGMVQDLVWEQYDLPVTLANLQAGNSPNMLLHPNPVTRLSPPVPPKMRVLINKTGSTNGFSAYAAFIPADRSGILLLANRNFPIPLRIATAYAILAKLNTPGLASIP